MKAFRSLAIAGLASLPWSLPAFAEEAAGAAEHGGEHGGGVFPPFDPQWFTSNLFWLAVLFGFLYWVMSTKALPRIASIKEERRAQIERDLAAAAQMQKKAEDAEKAYTTALAKAKTDAQVTADAARNAASKAADQRRTEVESQMAQKLNAAEADITAAKAKAMSNVNDIAVDAAAEIIKSITGKAPTAADVKAALAAQG